ncbi:MAG: tRNA lysidine(34) synthetase TilS [Ferruginibacter sp.]
MKTLPSDINLNNKSLQQSFEDYISREQLFNKRDRLLVAVSGGVDSVVLTQLCSVAGFQFDIAHCNFQLRDKESDEDANFVELLGEKYKVCVFVKKFDTADWCAEHKKSTQEGARELRYAWFREVLAGSEGKPYSRLLTAHHADDNVETLLMNFFKGTGINGLKAITPLSGNIARPILFATKKILLEYAFDNGLAWREDASNLTDNYTRNYFRNQLLPGIEKVFPQVRQNLASNITRFNEIREIYKKGLDQDIKKLVGHKGETWQVPVNKLLKASPLTTLVYEIFHPFNFAPTQTQELIKLAKASTGSQVISSTHRVLKNRNWFIISALHSVENFPLVIEASDESILFPQGKLEIKKIAAVATPDINRNVVTVDAHKISFPILLRPVKKGDYFYPFGMFKPSGRPVKKKLSRYFSDLKLSRIEKENAWVLESQHKIFWVVNHRPDERFRLSGNEKSLLKINLISSKKAG